MNKIYSVERKIAEICELACNRSSVIHIRKEGGGPPGVVYAPDPDLAHLLATLVRVLLGDFCAFLILTILSARRLTNHGCPKLKRFWFKPVAL